MICPVCQTGLPLKDDSYECDGPLEHKVHNFQYTIEGNFKRFIIILNGIYLEQHYYHWEIITFNQFDQQELREIKISQGENVLSPVQAYQLLLRYKNLVVFS